MESFDAIELRANDLVFSAVARGDGPVVLCLHGFPDQMRSFRHQLPALADAGYRAIAPTLRGYEPSSQPADGDYHIVRMAEDVLGWIDDLGEERVHLVGHDWGAIIAYAAGALAGDRCHSITTMAIPHPGAMQRHGGLRKHPVQLRNSWYILFFQLRGLADAVVEASDWAFIDKLWRDWSPGWDWPEEELAAVKRTLAAPGVKRAALGYYRAMFGFGAAATRSRELLDSPVRAPTLALTGALDGCMDTRMHDLAMHDEDFPKGLSVVRLEDAGHFLHQEKPGETNRLLLEWIRRYSPSH